MAILISKNLNYFSIPTLENSYWAGFIAADGCIDRVETSGRLRFNLNSQDEEHLKLFAKHCQYEGQLKYFERNNKRYVVLEITSAKQWVTDLFKNFNITAQKTFTLQFPYQLNAKQQLAFIKGYIDGDGSISKSTSRHKIVFDVVGTESVLTQIKNIADLLSPPNFSKTKVSMKIRARGKIFQYTLCNNRAIKMLNILNDLPTPCLARKWDKLEEFLNGQIL